MGESGLPGPARTRLMLVLPCWVLEASVVTVCCMLSSKNMSVAAGEVVPKADCFLCHDIGPIWTHLDSSLLGLLPARLVEAHAIPCATPWKAPLGRGDGVQMGSRSGPNQLGRTGDLGAQTSV